MPGFDPPQFAGGYQSPGLGGSGMDSVGMSTGSTPSGTIEAPGTADGRCTLDEPVTETIMRDLRSIGTKLKYVMLPRARADKAHGLKNWDLWGPLFLCLALGIMLSAQAENSEQAGLAFALVFIIVWVGSGIVTLNALLLKGQISFFQSVCVLGYCIFPLVIAAFFSLIIQNVLLKVIFVCVGFTWATGASVGFMSELVPEDRKALGVYPVWLFYVAIAWMILIS
uniref:Protein YIPF n=1 Tax=Alexandrium catenella TaxID=2925 RepID=A0A7S1S3N7_ALECA